MPEIDGLEATRILRDRQIELPIIALTANAVGGHQEACIDAGMNDYLTKPLTLQALATVMERWMGSQVA